MLRALSCCAAGPVLASRDLGGMVADGDREQLAQLFGFHRVRDVLKRSALGEFERLADHARRLVEHDGNPAALLVDQLQHLGGGTIRDGQVDQDRANRLRFE